MAVLVALGAGALASFAASALSVSVLGRRAVLDVPNHRSSHTTATVRGAGIGLGVGTLVALAIAHSSFNDPELAGLVVAGVGFGVIGLVDDLTGALSAAARLALQVIVATGVVVVISQEATYTVLVTSLVGLVAAVWIVAFVNAFNFMDGINGISCAQAITAGVAFSLIAWHGHDVALLAGSLALVAGSIGFVPFNFPRARAFLGDVGSYFAGAWLAVLVIVGLHESIPPEAMLAPVALYLADTGVTLTGRLVRHEPWSEPHRDHAYQRLVDLGWSHTRTTLVVFVTVAVCSLLGSVSVFGSTQLRIGADCAALAVIASYLLLPSIAKSRSGTGTRRADLL
ncbi:MAG: MraY family glycosyltransferase [Acidimicrobiales bacterium]